MMKLTPTEPVRTSSPLGDTKIPDPDEFRLNFALRVGKLSISIFRIIEQNLKFYVLFPPGFFYKLFFKLKPSKFFTKTLWNLFLRRDILVPH